MRTLIILFVMTLMVSFDVARVPGPSHLIGAWETEIQVDGNTARVVKIITPSYFIMSTYTPDAYISASGGTWTAEGGKINETYEFHTLTPDKVGNTFSSEWAEGKDDLQMDLEGESMSWTRIDDGSSELMGAWRFTGRERNGEMTRSMELRPRRTFKILSGTRFQWAAYNVETREFSGTGGGTYTLKDGKYTEIIEVFSRDNSRVGASLEFDYDVQEKDWHHSGFSSKGAPMYEIWTNQDK